MVGLAGGQLVADTEVAPPGRPAQGHADAQLGVLVLGEKPPAEFAQPRLQGLVHAVPDGIEEAALPARLPEPRGDCPPAGVAGDQFAHVNDRDVRKVLRLAHETVPLSDQPGYRCEDPKTLI